jgi:uncharacterized protein (DUF488 family)
MQPSPATPVRGGAPALVFTIGHSTRTIGEFLDLLVRHDIRVVADVRRFPGSRRHPQFGHEALAASLAEAAIGYEHWPELGGRRPPLRDSPNTAWRNAGFRGYADYMATPEFDRAISALTARASQVRTAIMCAEAVPWRCHRMLIADALVADGVSVRHILGAGVSSHVLSPSAVSRGRTVTYPQPTGHPGSPDLFEGSGG